MRRVRSLSKRHLGRSDRGGSISGDCYRFVVLNMCMRYRLIRTLRCATIPLLPVAHPERFSQHVDSPKVALTGSSN